MFYYISVFKYASELLTFDVDQVSEQHRAGFVSADVGKTIDRVLTRLLQTAIKFIFVPNFGVIH